MAICNEEGCQVAITGRCVNNLALDLCPHYNIDLGDDLEEIEESSVNITTVQNAESKVSDDITDVYSGKVLELTDVNRISSSGPTKLIMLAGMPDAGKTTLILSLMHLFQTRPGFSGFLFAGSKTLLDFEEKLHPSKTASENDAANTTRTPDKSPQFLHLKLYDSESHALNNILFTDISGERFKAIRDSSVVAKNFTLALRADSFVLFFDTKRITSLEERASSKSSALGILKSLIQAGSLENHTDIQVVFSRWDLYSKEDQELHGEYIDLLKNDIEKLLANNFNLSFFEIASRPANSDLEFGHGVDNLLKAWIESDHNKNQSLPLRRHIKTESTRQFLNFGLKL